MNLADALRVVAVAETIVCCAGFVEPMIAFASGSWRVWLLVAAVETYMFSCAMAVVAHFGEGGVAWYRTPATVVAGAVGIAYLVIYRRDARRARGLRRNLEGGHDKSVT